MAPARSRRRYLRLAIALLLAVATSASAAKRAIIVAESGSVEQDAADAITATLTARGFTVTRTSNVPSDLDRYCCAYDLRSFQVLSPQDKSRYLAFLQDGHGLHLTGENTSCCAARNNSITDFITDDLGGGPTSVVGEISGIYVEAGVSGHPVVAGVGSVTYNGFGGGIFGGFGNGTIVTRSIPLASQAAAVWDAGDLTNATTGRLVSTLDINWMADTLLSTQNQKFLENIGLFNCPVIDDLLEVEITDPLTFDKECPDTVTVVGVVRGRDADCEQATAFHAAPIELAESETGPRMYPGGVTGDAPASVLVMGSKDPVIGVVEPQAGSQSLMGLRIKKIEVRVNGGPWSNVTSASPALPANAPISFTAAGLGLALGGNTIEIRATDSDTPANTAFDSITGTLLDTLPPVIDPTTCLDEIVDLGPGCTLDYNGRPTADDICDPTVTVTAVPPLPFSFTGPGTQGFDYTARDDSANTDTCARDVTARDIGGPSIGCPATITLECLEPGGLSDTNPDVAAWLASVTVADNCDLAPLLDDDHPAFFGAGCSPGLSTTVTWVAEDASGNDSTCASPLVVIDTTPPDITATPDPLTLECNVLGGVDVTDPAVQAWLAEFTADDLCFTTAHLDNDAPTLFPVDCGGAPTSVTFGAEDDCANRVTFAQDLSVIDTTAPTITPPAPLALECNEPGGVSAADPRVVAWIATAVSSDVCGTVSIVDDVPALIPSGCGGLTTTVTFVATDACGNFATTTSTITITDTTAPTLIVPTDITLECNSPGGVPLSDPAIQAFLTAATAADACGGSSLSNDAPTLFLSGCGGNVTTVSFTAIDDCGNTIVRTANVTVIDTTPPALTVPGPLALECNSPGGVSLGDPAVQAWLASAAATDICGTATITTDTPALIPSGCGAGTTTTVTFTAVDDCGNPTVTTSTITVVDTTAPDLAVPLNLNLECNSAGGIAVTDPAVVAWLASAAATDICGSATITHDAPALIPSGCGGLDTTVQFTATDDCGNARTLTAVITVRDTTAPALVVPTPLELECNITGGVDATDPAIVAWLATSSAADICDGATLTNDAPPFYAAGCGPGAVTTVTFNAVDNCTNLATGGSTVTVKDTTAPDLTVAAPLTLECNSPGGVPASDPRIVAWLGAATGSDICNAFTITHDAPALFEAGCGPGQVTTVTFTATDDCGNLTVKTSTVTVVDTTPPALVVPVPLTLECNDLGGVPATDPAVQAWLATAAAADVCGGATIVNDLPALIPAGCIPGSVTTVTFTATDDCGNAIANTSTVTVVDTTAPVLHALMRPADPLPPTSSTSPASPRPPASPRSVCSPPTSRHFLIDCGITDTCDPNPTIEVVLIATVTDVPAAGVCAPRVERIAVTCGELVEIQLLPPACPASPRSPASTVGVNSAGQKLISAESVVLEATGTDQCGNTATATWDPATEPDPECTEVLEDGTCCPAIGQPPDPACSVPLCGRCRASVVPAPIADHVSGVGEGCDRPTAEAAALLQAAAGCVGPFDPGCAGGCDLAGAGCGATASKRAKSPKSQFDCAKITLGTCLSGKGYRCTLTGAVDCGCACD